MSRLFLSRNIEDENGRAGAYPSGDGGGGDGSKVRRAVIHLDQGGRRTPVAGTRWVKTAGC
eukprot:COSAG01_NODE_489_length_16370_cov_7.973818_6_plen_61_part_00